MNSNIQQAIRQRPAKIRGIASRDELTATWIECWSSRPGPNMAYLAVLGASRGRVAGFFAVLGVALGLALLGIAVGLGGGSLVLNNRVVYESLR